MFVQNSLSFSLSVLLLLLLFCFFFSNLPSHSSFTCSFIFNELQTKVFCFNLLVYISVNLLSYQGVFVFCFFLAMFCVASPIECASQGLFGS